jgi:hypothetical protein
MPDGPWMRAVKDSLPTPLLIDVRGKRETRSAAGLLRSRNARPEKGETDGLVGPLCSRNAHGKAVVVRRTQ